MNCSEIGVLERLQQVILDRKNGPREGSYTCYLFEKGMDKILKKVGEECTETIIAVKNGDKSEVVQECSDLIYHIMIMLTDFGIDITEVLAELDKRSQKVGNLKTMRETDKES